MRPKSGPHGSQAGLGHGIITVSPGRLLPPLAPPPHQSVQGTLVLGVLRGSALTSPLQRSGGIRGSAEQRLSGPRGGALSK